MSDGLPNGWAWTTLGEVTEFVMGQAPPGAASNFDGVGTPFVKAGEFGSVRPLIREWTTQPLKFARDGDVLICVVGATAGKLNLGATCAIGRSVAAIRPHEGIDQRFVYLQLLPKVLELRAASAGSAQGVISSKDLAAIPFALAPSAEQRRIVAALEEHLSDLDAAAAGLERARANVERYQFALLEQAYQAAEADPTCEWLTLAALARNAGYGTSQRCEHDAPGPGVLRILNIVDGRVSTDDLKRATAPADLPRDGAVAEGDFLIVRTNGSRDLIGRAALVTETPSRPLYFASYLIRYRLVPDASARRWLSALWSAPSMRSKLEALAASSAGQYNLSVGKLDSVALPFPAPAVRDAVVASIEERRAVANRTAADLGVQLARAARLRQAVLRRAFAGRLVPQDPADEPASALLERLRAERAPAARSQHGRRPVSRS